MRTLIFVLFIISLNAISKILNQPNIVPNIYIIIFYSLIFFGFDTDEMSNKKEK